MASIVPLPTGSYVTADPRASCKRLIGCFSELLGQDSPADAKTVPPITLRRMAGTTTIATDGTVNAVRGMWEMAGVQYAVIGSTLYSVALNPAFIGPAALTQVGTGISGTGFVRMTDNGACLVIVVPGTSLAWTFSVSGGFQTLSAAFFTGQGAIDCWYIDSFIVFLAVNGTTFFNDDGRIVSGNGQITFTSAATFTREFGTDPFVGMCVDHREILFFGTRTSEGYVNAGNPTGSPFASAPDSFMQMGAHPLAGYTVALQDQSVFWVANDRTVRRRAGQTPTRVSNSGIEQVLATASLRGAYAFSPTVGGHPLYVLTLPADQRTLVYDCLTEEWFELESLGLGFWRPLCFYNGFGLQLVGDSQSGSIGYLDVTTFTEFGGVQLCAFTTQGVFDQNNRIQHRRVEVVATAGQAPDQTAVPIIDIFSSDDNGETFQSFADVQNLGGQGQFDQRAFIFNAGQSRNRVYQMRVTDPTLLFTVGVFATLEGGKW